MGGRLRYFYYMFVGRKGTYRVEVAECDKKFRGGCGGDGARSVDVCSTMKDAGDGTFIWQH